MKFYCEDKEKVLHELGSNEDGLTSAESAKRLEANGKNRLAEAKGKSLIRRFFEQLAEPMTIILIVAAIISAGVEIYNGHVKHPTFRNRMAAAWAEHYDLIPTSGSDLHTEDMMISGGIETDEPIKTNEQLLAVLRSRSYNILRNDALFDPNKK